MNCTGYSGQGVHTAQRELIREAFASILKDQGWDPDETLLISGGTAVGIPDEFISSLTGDGYHAAAIMALPGIAYPLTPGYSLVCTQDNWTNWGDEVATMAKVSTETVVAGGGAQALTDALHAAQDGELIFINGMFERSGNGQLELTNQGLCLESTVDNNIAEVDDDDKDDDDDKLINLEG